MFLPRKISFKSSQNSHESPSGPPLEILQICTVCLTSPLPAPLSISPCTPHAPLLSHIVYSCIPHFSSLYIPESSTTLSVPSLCLTLHPPLHHTLPTYSAPPTTPTLYSLHYLYSASPLHHTLYSLPSPLPALHTPTLCNPCIPHYTSHCTPESRTN